MCTLEHVCINTDSPDIQIHCSLSLRIIPADDTRTHVGRLFSFIYTVPLILSCFMKNRKTPKVICLIFLSTESIYVLQSSFILTVTTNGTVLMSSKINSTLTICWSMLPWKKTKTLLTNHLGRAQCCRKMFTPYVNHTAKMEAPSVYDGCRFRPISAETTS